MKTLEYRTVDKSTWGPGPWQIEPDKLQFTDAATGLPCLIVRNHSGALCGYVGVVEGHPWFGKDYDDIDATVHGGLSFADLCAVDGDDTKHICHVPDEGEPHRLYWFGFDCAHAWDLAPAYRSLLYMERGDESYRDLAYVRREIQGLARQAIEAQAANATGGAK